MTVSLKHDGCLAFFLWETKLCLLSWTKRSQIQSLTNTCVSCAKYVFIFEENFFLFLSRSDKTKGRDQVKQLIVDMNCYYMIVTFIMVIFMSGQRPIKLLLYSHPVLCNVTPDIGTISCNSLEILIHNFFFQIILSLLLKNLTIYIINMGLKRW